MKRLALFVAYFVLVGFTIPSAPPSMVLDEANKLSPAIEAQISAALLQYEQDSAEGIEVAVAIIESLEGESVETVAEQIFNAWGVGRRDQDNGVLLLVAIDDRAMRIEVGYGLEHRLTDAESGRILDQVLKPAFRSGDFELGIQNGVAAILRATAPPLEGRERIDAINAAIARDNAHQGNNFWFFVQNIIFVLFILFVVVVIWLIVASDGDGGYVYRGSSRSSRSSSSYSSSSSSFSSSSSSSSSSFGGGSSGGGGASGGW